MKKTFVLTFVSFLMIGFLAHATPPEIPSSFTTTVTLTSFGGGTQEVVGNQLQIRGLTVDGLVSGDFVGTDRHLYNANFDLTTSDGRTWGLDTLTLTSPCVGTFEGVFSGTSVTGDFADQDAGSFVLNGGGGCEGYILKGKYTEPADGVFVLHGTSKKLKP